MNRENACSGSRRTLLPSHEWVCTRTPEAFQHPGCRKRCEVVGGWSGDSRQHALEFTSSDVHNAPEMATQPMAPSADIWSLGVTLVEALTQQSPVWDSAGGPNQCSLIPFQGHLTRLRGNVSKSILCIDARSAKSVSCFRESRTRVEPQECRRRTPQRVALRNLRRRGYPVMPLIVGFVLLMAIIVGLTLRSHKTRNGSAAVGDDSAAAASRARMHSACANPYDAESAKGEVLHRICPMFRNGERHDSGRVALRSASQSIPPAAVTNAELASQGPAPTSRELRWSRRGLEVQATDTEWACCGQHLAAAL